LQSPNLHDRRCFINAFVHREQSFRFGWAKRSLLGDIRQQSKTT